MLAFPEAEPLWREVHETVLDLAPEPMRQRRLYSRPKRQAVEWLGLMDNLLTFDTSLQIGALGQGALGLLGLGRGTATRFQSLSDLLDSSPRLEPGATAALVQACAAATWNPAEEEREVFLEGAPGLGFTIRNVGTGTWALAIQSRNSLPGGGGLDGVTGLADFAMFSARVSTALVRPGRRPASIAVHVLDLDGLRHVSANLGHAAQEELLRAAARRLSAAIRGTDLVARLAGDEFAILQIGVTTASQAEAMARRLTGLLAHAYMVLGETVTITPRLGFVLAPEDGNDAAMLLRCAGLARSSLEADGENTPRWCRFSPDMDARAKAQRNAETALRNAVCGHQFELHYQPLIALPAGRLTGFEALIRWRHPETGLVPPADFLPLADRLGLMGRIGEWVIREACRTAASWPESLSVSINIAPAQFKDGRLVETLRSALTESGLAPQRLELEVTETVLLPASGDAPAQLAAIRALGCHIAMDDFGTGYSSLTQLRSFPFDRLKVDRSFIRDLPESAQSLAILRSVLGLGRSLGIAVTAEGVETADQMRILILEGCNSAQGYLIGKPQQAEAYAKLIASPPQQGLGVA
ncbi:MAG: GGDEF domain-containing protein [Roseomonas sp.]|nr:GGDEF domain-containing protein [Roseomonas sp.]MCA3327504.1 GGDEF domain-containing protein [Roseomonas sp.]MCA3331311.1 GGDEF domain-containing protein [Roseomonas sp.]MCA3335937.1 GGDEF domain-containing protein [Roseomonas sp.]MCA3347545.1 GGDEF domain-containing protein [Roseomonas sp.]